MYNIPQEKIKPKNPAVHPREASFRELIAPTAARQRVVLRPLRHPRCCCSFFRRCRRHWRAFSESQRRRCIDRERASEGRGWSALCETVREEGRSKRVHKKFFNFFQAPCKLFTRCWFAGLSDFSNEEVVFGIF